MLLQPEFTEIIMAAQEADFQAVQLFIVPVGEEATVAAEEVFDYGGLIWEIFGMI